MHLKQQNKVIRLLGEDFRINHQSIEDKFIYPINEPNKKKFDEIFFKLTGENEGY